MALNSCPDCGNQVSTEAAACPKCGRPATRVVSSAEAGGSHPAHERGNPAKELLDQWGHLSHQWRVSQAHHVIRAANPQYPVDGLDQGQLHYLLEKLAVSGALPPVKSGGNPWKLIGIVAAVLIGIALIAALLAPDSGNAPASGPALRAGALYSVTDEVLACRSTDDSGEWGQFEKANDTRSRAAYLLDGKCMIILPGQKVTLMDLGVSTVKVVKDGAPWYVGRGAVEKFFRPAD
jgi:hypothetical protein